MAENDFLLRLPGDDLIVRRRRRGFGAFCALMAFAIAALAITSFRPGSAPAGRAEGRTAIAGGDGSSGEDPASGGGTAGTVSGGADALGSSGGGTAASLQRLIDAGQPIYCGAGTKPLVALT